MASVKSYNDILNRIGGGFSASEVFWGEQQTTFTSVVSGSSIVHGRMAFVNPYPNPLPTGVSAYIPVFGTLVWPAGTSQFMIGKVVNFGSLNIGTNVFTVGSSMPTVTELGVSEVTASSVLIEVTTQLNATPGNLTVTYTDQGGTSGLTTASQSLTASAVVGSVGLILLNSGDWGAQAVTGATQSGGTTPSGVVKFWGIVPLMFLNTRNVIPIENLLTGQFNLNRFGAGDQLGVFSYLTTTGAVIGKIYSFGDS